MQHQRKNAILSTSVIACVVGLAGCNKHYRVDPVMSTSQSSGIPWTETSATAGFGTTEVEKINPYTYNGSTKEGVSGKSFYATASDTAEPDLEKRKEARNQLQSAIMRISDESTAIHLTAIKAAENNSNLFLGLPALGMSAAAAVSPLGAANSLSAGSTALQGSRSFVNEQVFRNALFDSIILLIQEDRHAKKEAIRENWSKSIAEYNVEAALQDAAEYHQAGSFYHGLALLADAANDKANKLRGSRSTLESPGVLSTFASKTDIARAESRAEAAADALKRLEALKASLEAQIPAIDAAINAAEDPAKKAELEGLKEKTLAQIATLETQITAANEGLAQAKEQLKQAQDKYREGIGMKGR
jgi:hypothetical protein